MRNLAIAITGFVAGSILMVGLVVGLDQTSPGSTRRATSAMPRMSATSMMASQLASRKRLTIQHVGPDHTLRLVVAVP